MSYGRTQFFVSLLPSHLALVHTELHLRICQINSNSLVSPESQLDRLRSTGPVKYCSGEDLRVTVSAILCYILAEPILTEEEHSQQDETLEPSRPTYQK